MPILYDLVGIWNLMDSTTASSWYKAFLYIEGIKESELLSEENNSLLTALHFGVSTGTGEAHSAYYSNDPNSEYRALIQVDEIPSILGSAGEDEQKLLILGDGMTNENSVSLPLDKAVCGIKTTRMLPRPLIPSCYERVNWDEVGAGDGDDRCRMDTTNCMGCNVGNTADIYCGSQINHHHRVGDRPYMQDIVRSILPRQKSVSKIELQLCNIEDGIPSTVLPDNLLNLGEIDQTFPSPESPNLSDRVKTYYEKYKDIAQVVNSSVKDMDTDTELNIQNDKAICDEGYIMDGIRVRKCLEEGRDPLCINDYVFDNDPWPRIYYKGVSECKNKLIWEKELSLVRKPYGGILGIQISCNKPNGLPSDRIYKEVFCTNIQPDGFDGPGFTEQQKEDLTRLCGDETQWDPWTFLPRGEGTFWTFSGGVAESKRNTLFYAQFPDMRYNGITDLQLTARENVEPGSGFSGDVVTYSATWSGKGSKPVALFASTIRGHIGSNDYEEDKELSIEDASTNERTIAFLNTIPFAISDDFSSPGVIAMSRFNRRASDLQSFSFLTADDFQENRQDFIIGVVSNEGQILNDFNGNAPFTVKVESKKGDNQKRVFSLSLDSESAFLLFVFPHWYTDGGLNYPLTPAAISVAVKNDDGDRSFKIKAGSGDLKSDGSRIARNLGFDFLAVNKTLTNANIEVGTATMEDTDTDPQEEVEFNMIEICQYFGIAECKESTTTSEFKFSKFEHTFQNDYLSNPSVIVTPVLNTTDSNGCNDMDTMWQFSKTKIEMPHCVVETITKKYFTAKCGCVTFSTNSEGTVLSVLSYEPLKFNYLAVGPVEEQNVDTENFNWSDLV